LINLYKMSIEQELMALIEELKKKSKEMECQIEKLSKTITDMKEQNKENIILSNNYQIEYNLYPVNRVSFGRQLNPKLVKYQQLTKIVREASVDKGIRSVDKITKKVLEEAKKLYPTKDFIDQVDEAKILFNSNSKRYL